MAGNVDEREALKMVAATTAAIPSAALHSGRNEIGLRIVARAPKLKSKLIVEAAEVLISPR